MTTTFSGHAGAETARLAVATNFVRPVHALAEVFAADTGHSIIVSTGATGRLYAQIVNGAPFDMFLAADTARPARLIEDGLAIAGSARTYATGRLALMDLRDPAANIPSPLQRLEAGDYRRLALANPDLAPYGAAARQVLAHLGHGTVSARHQVFGENIGQAYAFIATGNADLGFVALSQIQQPGNAPAGRYDVIPGDWHDPIRQDAVLLVRGTENAAARAFLDFLASSEARDIIAAHGYGAPE